VIYVLKIITTKQCTNFVVKYFVSTPKTKDFQKKKKKENQQSKKKLILQEVNEPVS